MKNTDSPFPIYFQRSCSHVSFSGQRLFVSTSTGQHTKNSHRLATLHFSFCVADKPSYPYAGLAECARRVSAAPGAAWVLGVSNNNSKCQNSFIKSHDVTCPPLFLPPGGPAHSAGPTPNPWKTLPLGHPWPPFFDFGIHFFVFWQIFACLKNYKKTSSKKHAPKSQKSPP